MVFHHISLARAGCKPTWKQREMITWRTSVVKAAPLALGHFRLA